jgi:TonB-linked SusC/RagA family outer membrane protein
MTGQRFNYLYEYNENTWVLNLGEMNDQRVANSAYNGEFALFGIFGRADYAFADKYLFTGILRRDGVSRFSQNNRYGTFPSVSVGWRISEEKFLENTREWLDDLKARIGYGQTGNAEIPRKNNYAYEYTTDSRRTNYDLNGANTSGSTGYRLQYYGNEDTKWEAIESFNVGIDATVLNGKFGLGVEWYSKTTTDMLLPGTYSAIAGEPVKPYINFGDMRNTGVDLNFNYRDAHGDLHWDVALNLTHYKNEVIRLAEADDYAIYQDGVRLTSGPVTRTTKGRPISEFFGYKVDGFYESVQDVLNCQPLGQILTAEEAAQWIGRFKFKDYTGDGKLTEDDRVSLGSPHPDLLAGLNLGLGYKNWDLTMFWYASIGNELFNNVKAFTDFNLFRGERSPNSLYKSWKPGADNSDAVLPFLNAMDNYSGVTPSSYFVEDASFLRLKNIVVGYSLPKNVLQKAGIQKIRLYLQAENTITISKYSGLDPEFTNANISNEVSVDSDTGVATGADLRKGIDMGGWPNIIKFIGGVSFTF